MNILSKKHSIVRFLLIAGAGCLLYASSAGVRVNYGLMLNHISDNSGVPYSSVSFVLAIAQLVFGITQPLFGVLAIRKSNTFVLVTGAVFMVAGLTGIPFCHSMWPLLLFLGILLPAGTGAISFGIIMGAISPLLSEKESAVVSGIVTAGSGLGSTILSPVIQKLLAAGGLQTTMLGLCVPIICLIPVSFWLSASRKKMPAAKENHTGYSLKSMFRDAFRSRSFLFLMMGFFTCGFHMAIIETHLFSQFVSYGLAEEVVAYAFSSYGIAAVLGSIISGILDSKFPMKIVLGGIYTLRVVIVLFLIALPKTVFSMFVVAILLGFTATSTVPPTSGLVGKLFGTAKMATLFGMVFVAHQIGGFFSSWLGGICAQATGGYSLIWITGIFLSAIAAAVSFAIKETP